MYQTQLYMDYPEQLLIQIENSQSVIEESCLAVLKGLADAIINSHLEDIPLVFQNLCELTSDCLLTFIDTEHQATTKDTLGEFVETIYHLVKKTVMENIPRIKSDGIYIYADAHAIIGGVVISVFY